MNYSVFGKPSSENFPSVPASRGNFSVFKKISQEPLQNEPSTEEPSDYDIPDEFAERLFEKGVSQVGARLAEGAIGTPGNIASLANTLTGGNVPSLKKAEKVLPTTSDLREFSEKHGQGYLTPEGELDKVAGEFLTDIGAGLPFGVGGTAAKVATGIGGKIAQAARFWRPIGTPLIGQATKQLVKELGSGETTQESAKIGSMIFTDVLLNRGKGSQGYINHLFQEADKSLTGSGKANVNNLRKSLIQFRKDLDLGGSSPEKTAASTKINEILTAMNRKGKEFFIDPKQFPAFRKSINSVRESMGGWQAELPPNIKRRAIKNLESVKKDVIDSGMEYGKKHNPEFAKNWASANEAANVRSRSNVALNFIKDKISPATFKKILGGSLAAHATHSAVAQTSFLGPLAKGVLVGVPTAAAGSAIYNFSKVAYRMAKSPVLQKYYNGLIKSAIKQDGSAVAKFSEKIEKDLQREDESEKSLIKGILKE